MPQSCNCSIHNGSAYRKLILTNSNLHSIFLSFFLHDHEQSHQIFIKRKESLIQESKTNEAFINTTDTQRESLRSVNPHFNILRIKEPSCWSLHKICMLYELTYSILKLLLASKECFWWAYAISAIQHLCSRTFSNWTKLWSSLERQFQQSTKFFAFSFRKNISKY